MNETNIPAGESGVPWPIEDQRTRAPGASTLPGSDSAGPAAAGMLNSAARGAHDSIDRLTDRAEPAMQHLGESVSAAKETLHAKADQLRGTGDEWVEGMRSTVRSNPLAAIAAALALGAVIAHLTR